LGVGGGGGAEEAERVAAPFEEPCGRWPLLRPCEPFDDGKRVKGMMKRMMMMMMMKRKKKMMMMMMSRRRAKRRASAPSPRSWAVATHYWLVDDVDAADAVVVVGFVCFSCSVYRLDFVSVVIDWEAGEAIHSWRSHPKSSSLEWLQMVSIGRRVR